MKHEHGSCSNSIESFETFIGCKVTGVLRNVGRTSHSNLTLVFACGWGLIVCSNGSFWVANPEEIADAKKELKAELARAGV